MECWFSNIPCIACWEWWSVAVGVGSIVVSVSGYLWKHWTSEGQMDEFRAKHTIDDLERFGKIMKLFEERQDFEGTVYPTKSTDDMEFIYTFMDLQEDCKDWVFVDESTPQVEAARRKREEAIKSISLIREHGYKKALEIRKKELAALKNK